MEFKESSGKNKLDNLEQLERERIFAHMEKNGFDVINLSDIPQEIDEFFKESNSSVSEYEILVAKYLDTITEGKYSDKKNPNHVIDAHYEKGIKDRKKFSYLFEPLDFELNGKCWVVFGNSPFIDREPKNPVVIFTLENPVFKKIMEDQYSPDLNEWIERKSVEINKEKLYQVNQDEANMVPNIILDGRSVTMHSKIEGTYLKFSNPKLLKSLKEYGYTQDDKSVFKWPLIASYIIDLENKTMFKFNQKK